ncbi:MAG TPA: Hpt domain-containing protein [Pseudoxanthomonas sp.]|nr:Hpt domain-containing protein [Pseudoxanthomonas sp.]
MEHTATRRMLWVASSIAAAVRDGAIEPSLALRRAFQGVGRAVHASHHEGGAGAAAASSQESTRQLLYLVTQSPSRHAVLDALRETFSLDTDAPSEAELDHARGSVSGRNRALLDTVGGAVKEELLRIKDALDLHLRTDAPVEALQAQVGELGNVADTLGMMGLDAARGVVLQQRDALHEMVGGARAADEGALLSIAGALLYVDASLDDQVAGLGQSGGAITAPASSEALRTLDVLAREAIQNFASAREGFVAFIETNWNHEQLTEVPRLLSEVAGALRMLELPLPADYLLAVRQYVAVELIDRRRVPGGQQLDTLADAMASLEYYLEALRESRPNRDEILEITRSSLEKLRYWPVPAASDAAAVEPAAARSTAVEPATTEPMLAEPAALEPLAFESTAFEPAAFEPVAFEPETIQPQQPQAPLAAPVEPEPDLAADAAFEQADEPWRLEIPDPAAAADAIYDPAPIEFAGGLSLDIEEPDAVAVDEPGTRGDQDWQALDETPAVQAEEWTPLFIEPEAPQPARADPRTPFEFERNAVDFQTIGLDSGLYHETEMQAAAEALQAFESISIAGAPESNGQDTAAGGFKRVDNHIEDDIREVFLEEFDEEIGNLNQMLPLWIASPNNMERLRSIRRVFHTLKGSGRLVGANLLGEFSWKAENMLNRVLDGSRPPSPAVIAHLQQVAQVLPQLNAALRGQGQVNADLEALQDMADRIGEGEEVFYQPRSVAAAGSPAAPSHSTSLPGPAGGTHQPSEAAPAGLEPEGEGTPASLDGVLREILETEVAAHLETVDAWLLQARVESILPTEPLLRAFHTMNGAFAMADVPEITEVTGIAEQYVKRLWASSTVASPEGVAALADSAEAIGRCMAALRSPSPRIPVFSALSRQLAALRDALPESRPTVVLVQDSAPGTYPVAGVTAPSAGSSDEVGLAAFDLSAFIDAQDPAPAAGAADDLDTDDLAADDLGTAAPEAAPASEIGPVQDTYGRGIVPPGDAVISFYNINFTYSPIAARAADEARAAQASDEKALVFAAPPSAEGVDLDKAVAASEQEPADEPAFAPSLISGEAAEVAGDEGEDVARDSATAVAEVYRTDDIDVPATAIDVLELEPETEAAADDAPSDTAAPAERDLPWHESSLPPVEDASREPLERTFAVDAPPPEPVAAVSAPDDMLDFTELDRDLVDIFVEEGNELLDHSDGLLALLRETPDDRSLVTGLQRDLHTLKGGARMAGINAIGDLGHAIESLLEQVAAHRLELDRDGLRLLERGFDGLHGLVARVGAHRQVATPDGLIAEFEARAYPERAERQKAEQAAETAPASLGVAPSSEAPTVAAQAASAVALAPLSAPFDPGAADEEETQGHASQEQVRVRSDLLDRLVNNAGEVAIYRSRLEQQLGAFRAAMAELDRTNIRLHDQLRRLDLETEAQIVARYQREQDKRNPAFDPLELDRFSTLQQLSRGLAESAADLTGLQGVLDDLARQYDNLLQQQSRVSSELQDGLMRARMVPFDGLVPRLRRVLRQAASDTGKQVKLQIEGAHGELDRNVLERMTAPLEHLLRNAVAHGLETPEARREAGKPEEGTVHIALRREGAEMVLQVSDDGAGINHAAIRRRAEQRGLLQPGAAASDAELERLILESGFSTSDSISQLAGRGVGMDVVYSEVRQLGGSLEIASKSGRGTRFTLRLPQTLAVTQAVFVQIGETQFAVPVAAVAGVGRITRNRFETRGAVYVYSGEQYMLHDLGLLIGQPPARAEGQPEVPLLLVRAGDLRAAVAVDQVFGSREIVVKPVGPQIASVPGIYGATITGDGRIVVILDVAPLVRRHLQQPQLFHTDTPAPEERRVPLVMVVDDSLTMRKVTGRVLERHNFEVTAARDGVEALEKLEEGIPDLMLLDIEMPRMDGYELATAMKADKRFADIPIVMITSRTGDKHRQRALEIGVQRYMGKPYQELDLMRNVYDLLGIARVRE